MMNNYTPVGLHFLCAHFPKFLEFSHVFAASTNRDQNINRLLVKIGNNNIGDNSFFNNTMLIIKVQNLKDMLKS